MNVIDYSKIGKREEFLFSNADYYMYHEVNGEFEKLYLSGEEIFSTTCPRCGKEVQMPFGEFCAIMGRPDHDIYHTMICCNECSKKSHNL